MSAKTASPFPAGKADPKLSLYHLLDPQVLADPYPLYHRLRREAPVHWDPYLYAWVVTRYADIVTVLHQYSAKCAPTPQQLEAIGIPELGPVAQVMMRQMLFMDAPAHTRLRGLASMAFTPARVEALRSHIQEIVDTLMEPLTSSGRMDVIADLAAPLPAIVTSEMLGVPTSDRDQLKQWSEDFAEVLGNFQHNPNRAARTLKCVEEMNAYFRDAIRRCRTRSREGLVHSLVTAELDGDRLTEEEIIANCIVTMVGAQETTTNLIGNGVLSLLRNPDQLQRLKDNLNLIPSAVEELLRYESPSQHTTRIAPEDSELGGKQIRKGQAVIVVMGAGNRDPERFADPDRLDLGRRDNRHLAFGWASHFCFGAALARIEGQIAVDAIVSRLPELALEPDPLCWRENLGLRGLTSLPVTFCKASRAPAAEARVEQSESGCPFHRPPGGAL
jgi:pimeloyl-[acyl-carrier protein] synthase